MVSLGCLVLGLTTLHVTFIPERVWFDCPKENYHVATWSQFIILL